VRELVISGRRVADDTDAYVIAEIGHNHGGRLDVAEELVRRAAAAGADAVKLQKRDNERLFTGAMYHSPYTGPNSYGPTYGLHRAALEFGRAEYKHLIDVAKTEGVDLFATAFDEQSVDFLTELGIDTIKIASADVTNPPLLEYAAKAARTLIVSTGGAGIDDVRRACDRILPLNAGLALLQCTAMYPAAPADLNLSVITTFRQQFPSVTIGFSGHDLGPQLSWIAYTLGARVIEKHFTLDRAGKGTDHQFSLDPQQLTDLVDGLRRTNSSLGSPHKVMLPGEIPAIQKMGKKLVAARALPAGHSLTEHDIVRKSPGDGLKPSEVGLVLGRRLRIALQAEEDLRLDVLEA